MTSKELLRKARIECKRRHFERKAQVVRPKRNEGPTPTMKSRLAHAFHPRSFELGAIYVVELMEAELRIRKAMK